MKTVVAVILSVLSAVAFSAGTCEWVDSPLVETKLLEVAGKLKTEKVLDQGAKVASFCNTMDDTQYYSDGYAVWIKDSAVMALSNEELAFLILQQHALVSSNAVVQLAEVSMSVSKLTDSQQAEEQYHQVYTQLVTHSDQTAVNGLVSMQIHNALDIAEMTLNKLLKESNATGKAYELGQQNIADRLAKM